MLKKFNIAIAAAAVFASSSAFAMTNATYTSQPDPQSLGLGYNQSVANTVSPRTTAPAARMSTMQAPSVGNVQIDQHYLGYGAPHS
jgi:hypothetical protein